MIAMSKNLMIQKKKGEKSVPVASKKVKMLRTNLQGGGTCDWVPEDETILVPKVVDKDGTYVASDEGYYGYSEVVVSGIGNQVMGDLGTITITKNGTYYADKVYNGTGPFYGYKTVIVNVTKESNSQGDSSGGSSGSSDQSVTGKDSEGNYVELKVDENGVLKESKLATSIRVTSLPKFTVYRDGDPINYKGLKVTAYVGEEIYKNEKYPDGVIDYTDLILPVTTAGGSGGQTVELPVSWERPGDKIQLSTVLPITVND